MSRLVVRVLSQAVGGEEIRVEIALGLPDVALFQRKRRGEGGEMIGEPFTVRADMLREFADAALHALQEIGEDRRALGRDRRTRGPKA